MKRRLLKYTLLAVALVALFVCGTFATRNDFGLGRNMEIMVNFMHAISTQYVDKVDADEMMKSGAAGITAKLDPYTDFISEKEMPDFEQMTTGRYGGIGSLIRKKGDYVIIAEPYKGSPADESGLKIGDKIVAIDGKDMRGAEIENMEGATLFAVAREMGFRAVEIRAVSNVVGDEFKNWNIELATQNLAKTLKNYAE